jgi:dUTP pyrophosphatase
MQVKIKRLTPDATLPQYQTPGSVAFDLASSQDMVIAPRDIQLIPTGLVITTPPGFMLMLASRSSLPLKKGLTMANCVGIVDQDYCGPQDEIKIQAINLTEKPVEIKKGERVAQAMFVSIGRAILEEAVEFQATESRGGFGSTEGYAPTAQIQQ